MKTTKPAVILLALFLLIAAHPAEAMDKPKISNTRIASCLFKVTTTEEVLPLNNFAIEYLMRSSGVAGKAAREALDISPDIASELFEIEEVFALDSSLGGIPPVTTVPGRRFPTTARTPTLTPTARTARPGTTTTTPTRRPPTRPPTRRTPTVINPQPSTTEQTVLFHLRVDLSNADTEEPIKPAAQEFMIVLIENLRSALRGAFADYRTKVNQQVDLASNEAHRAEEELVRMQGELRNISGSRDLSRNVILSDISSLRRELQSAIMKRASDEVLMKAMTDRIAETQARWKQELQNDPITKELQNILDMNVKDLEAVQKLYKPGTAPLSEIALMREKVAKARIELAKRREDIINPQRGFTIRSLNDELGNFSIKVAVAPQEIRGLEEQLEQAKDLLKIADRYELLSLKVDIARQNLEETLLWRARLGRNIRSIQPPDVIVIGAE